MVKKVGVIIFIMLFILMSTGCSKGSYKLTQGSFQVLDSSIKGRYKSFTGYYYKEIKLKENDIINFNFLLITFSGRLSAMLLDSKGVLVEFIDEDKSVIINKTGTYQIKIEGRHHQGSFELSWFKDN
jgi:hypothetical protein